MKSYFIVVAIVLVAAVALIFYQYKNANTQTTKLTGLEIAKISYGLFDKMRRPNGWYYYYERCKEDGNFWECRIDSDSYPQTNAWVMLANLGLYDQTGEQKYLDNANNEMSILMNNCKDAGNTDCLWVLVQMAKLQKTTGNTNYLEKIKNFADKLMEVKTEKGSMMKGIEAREFAVVYGLTGNEKYLNESLSRLKETEEYLASDQVIYTINGLQAKQYSCIKEIAEMEIYKVTADKIHLNNVKAFFDAADAGSHGKSFYSLPAIQPCIEVLFSLYKETGDVKYWEQAYNITQYMITYRWDPPLEEAKKYNGDGAFLFDIYEYNNTKTLTDTGYAVYLLSMMKDTEFQIVRWNK